MFLLTPCNKPQWLPNLDTKSRSEEEHPKARSEARNTRPLQRRRSSLRHVRHLWLRGARSSIFEQWDSMHSCGWQPTQLRWEVDMNQLVFVALGWTDTTEEVECTPVNSWLLDCLNMIFHSSSLISIHMRMISQPSLCSCWNNTATFSTLPLTRSLIWQDSNSYTSLSTNSYDFSSVKYSHRSEELQQTTNYMVNWRDGQKSEGRMTWRSFPLSPDLHFNWICILHQDWIGTATRCGYHSHQNTHNFLYSRNCHALARIHPVHRKTSMSLNIRPQNSRDRALPIELRNQLLQGASAATSHHISFRDSFPPLANKTKRENLAIAEVRKRHYSRTTSKKRAIYHLRFVTTDYCQSRTQKADKEFLALQMLSPPWFEFGLPPNWTTVKELIASLDRYHPSFNTFIRPLRTSFQDRVWPASSLW